jgi:hypothetical protein
MSVIPICNNCIAISHLCQTWISIRSSTFEDGMGRIETLGKRGWRFIGLHVCQRPFLAYSIVVFISPENMHICVQTRLIIFTCKSYNIFYACIHVCYKMQYRIYKMVSEHALCLLKYIALKRRYLI